ncbi:MAG: phosphopantetheine-binding protein [Thermodesulfobacteriota bacterium]|nr:phosphopantetheine-binding protein [Thermodesulfobacteriota bacterium]
MKENREKIRAFLARYISTHDLRDDDDIFASGFVNSLFAMQLVLFVEGEFHLRIENEDLKIKNFRSINALSRLIERKVLQLNSAHFPG